MKTIKSFETFVGESNTFGNKHETNFRQINEDQIVPGVDLNPQGKFDQKKYYNDFYVVLNKDQVEFRSHAKNPNGDDNVNKMIKLTLSNKAMELGAIGMQGQYVTFVDILTPKPGGGKEQHNVLPSSLVKGSELESLKTSAVATNLLGIFIFESGIDKNPTAFKNLVKAIVKMKMDKLKYQKVESNPTFKAFYGGLINALNNSNAFQAMKNKDLDRFLWKLGGDNFRKEMTAAIEAYKS